MVILLRVILITVVILVLSGCGTNVETSPPEEGTVFEIEGDRVLILDSLKEEDIGKSWNELFENYQGSAIWLKTSDVSSLSAGDKVRYWVDGPVAESFPMQGSAKKIEVISQN